MAVLNLDLCQDVLGSNAILRSSAMSKATEGLEACRSPRSGEGHGLESPEAARPGYAGHLRHLSVPACQLTALHQHLTAVHVSRGASCQLSHHQSVMSACHSSPVLLPLRPKCLGLRCVWSLVQVQALRRAVEDLIGSPAFLVAQFTPPVPRPSGDVVAQGGTHGLDMSAIDHTFTTLLRVRGLLVLPSGSPAALVPSPVWTGSLPLACSDQARAFAWRTCHCG